MWRAAQNWPGWRSGLDLNSQDPSIQPSWIVVSIPLAMNWPHLLIANTYSGHVDNHGACFNLDLDEKYGVP
jgi:hypothetical protein